MNNYRSTESRRELLDSLQNYLDDINYQISPNLQNLIDNPPSILESYRSQLDESIIDDIEKYLDELYNNVQDMIPLIGSGRIEMIMDRLLEVFERRLEQIEISDRIRDELVLMVQGQLDSYLTYETDRSINRLLRELYEIVEDGIQGEEQNEYLSRMKQVPVSELMVRRDRVERLIRSRFGERMYDPTSLHYQEFLYILSSIDSLRDSFDLLKRYDGTVPEMVDEIMKLLDMNYNRVKIYMESIDERALIPLFDHILEEELGHLLINSIRLNIIRLYDEMNSERDPEETQMAQELPSDIYSYSWIEDRTLDHVERLASECGLDQEEVSDLKNKISSIELGTIQGTIDEQIAMINEYYSQVTRWFTDLIRRIDVESLRCSDLIYHDLEQEIIDRLLDGRIRIIE